MRRAALIAALTLTPAFCQGPPPGPGGPGGAPMQQGDGIWVRNAGYGELHTFDSCNGHQPQSGQYHHHVNPVCLRVQLEDNIETARTTRSLTYFREKASDWKHSPILGWANDGYPIYGPYGFSDPKDAASAVKRIRSGFRLREMTARTSLPDWTVPLHPGVPQQLSPSQYGPAVDERNPLGRYQEDYEWSASYGDLDQYNGRFAVTPEFPQGTYVYVVTIDDDGAPAFPYILGGQYYGNPSGGTARNIPAGLRDYFAEGSLAQQPSSSPALASWQTKNSKQNARVALGYNPAAEPKTTWPSDLPPGARAANSVARPVAADVQRIRESESAVYVSASGLASYVMGPWFDPLQPGGVFGNLPTSQNLTWQAPKEPRAAGSRTATGLGAVGMWVNGVAVFNVLDGSSYSNARGADVGGGIVAPTAMNVSAASGERGPLAPGSLVAAYPFFGSVLATATDSAASTPWPTELAGTRVSIRDSAGVVHAARVYSVSPKQVDYQVPEAAATGNAVVTISAGGATCTSNIQIDESYPHLFFADPSGLASAIATRGAGLRFEPDAIDLGSGDEETVLTLYGSGLGKASSAAATIGGLPAEVVSAGPQGDPGVDRYDVKLPRVLAGRGRVEVTVTVGERVSNTVFVTVK